MFGLNRKKKQHSDAHSTTGQTVSITAPVRGRLLPLSDVPDPVFSGGLMGPGFAVDPADGNIVAPVSGTVVTVPETHHAVGLRTPSGAEVLVHIGVDTVTLKGDGFTMLCSEGDEVEAGTPLLTVDVNAIRDRVPSLITPVIVTNSDGLSVGQADVDAAFGQPVLALTTP